jgi:uncharacterized membrane protein
MAANTGVHPIRIVGHPIYTMILPIPIICFIGTVITDLTYLSMPEIMWLDFSTWLLLAGLIAGGVAGVLLILELVRAGRARTSALVTHFALLLAAWIVEVFNSFVHARDGWTAVAGTGIILSIIGALLSIAAGWVWQSASARRVGEAA